jgi:hypothetical protein
MISASERPAVAARREQPALNLSRVAVCLHYVELLDGGAAQPCAYPHCRVMESMELDLLAYRFQDPPPFGSRLEGAKAAADKTPGRRPLIIHYPESFVYHSEGRAPALVSDTPQRKADILVSSTRFLHAGLRIWHLTLTPRAGETFSEFDLIKLIHLYDGRTERTALNDLIRFGLDGSDTMVTAAELPGLLGLDLQDGSAPMLRCGTLQLIVGLEDSAAEAATANPYLKVLETLRRARENDGGADARQLKAWMDRDCLERRIIMAYCGIVTGIFDFDRIDDEEALDTLEPTFTSSSAFLRIHRRTLISIAEDDRAMRECWNNVGISPYLIIPHAAMVGNESLVDRAEMLLDEVLANPSARLTTLEAAHLEADSKLNTLYLPNIFNYITERSLFEQGSVARGSDSRRDAVLAKLDQLKDGIGIVREHERNRGQIVIQSLLGLISLLQIKSVVHDIFEWHRESLAVWSVIGFCMFLLGAAIWWSQQRGLQRRIVKRRSAPPSSRPPIGP